MKEQMAAIEFCMRDGGRNDAESLARLAAALGDPEWRVRYAAAVALETRRAPEVIDALLAALAAEDAAPLFSQPEEYVAVPAGSNAAPKPEFPAGTDRATIEAWRRRGRLKQAICLALGAIGSADGRVLEALHRQAVDAVQDYAVRAAACKALGAIRSPASRAVLERAAADDEWCTRNEAQKALAAVG